MRYRMQPGRPGFPRQVAMRPVRRVAPVQPSTEMITEEVLGDGKFRGKLRRWDCVEKRLPVGVPLLGAEIGVWSGKFSERILEALPLLTLYLVDRWAPPAPGDSYYSSGSRMAKQPASVYRRALSEAHARVDDFAKDRALWLQGDSAAMARRVKDGSLDFIFVDADHSFAGVIRDLGAWVPKLKPGGLACGHDYNNPGQGGVAKAVEKFFIGRRIEIDDDHTWFVRMS